MAEGAKEFGTNKCKYSSSA